MSWDYPSDWDTRRKNVYRRDDFQCQNCGRQGGPSAQLNLNAHHIVPKRNGGTHKLSNLITVCEQCHSAIHDENVAPTGHSQLNAEDFQLTTGDFSDAFSEMQSFLIEVHMGVSIDKPGKILDDEIEQQRISLIQELGKLSLLYSAPDERRQEAMENMIASWIELLRFPEDVWDTYNEEDLSREQTKELAKDLPERRSQESAEAMEEVISLGVESFFQST